MTATSNWLLMLLTGVASSAVGVIVIRSSLLLAIVLVFGGCTLIAVGGLKLALHSVKQ